METYRDYHSFVQSIHAPEELKEELLQKIQNPKISYTAEAVRYTGETGISDYRQYERTTRDTQDPERRGRTQKLRPDMRTRRRVWRGAVAAACACALLAGTFGISHFYSGASSTAGSHAGEAQLLNTADGSGGMSGGGTQIVQSRNRFYLAAPDQETSVTQNQTDGESTSDDVWTLAIAEPSGGSQYFPGCEFWAGGDNIRSITLQIDKGGLYTVASESMPSFEEAVKKAAGLASDPEQTDYEIEESTDPTQIVDQAEDRDPAPSDGGTRNDGVASADNETAMDVDTENDASGQRDSAAVTLLTKTYAGQTLVLEGGETVRERIGFYLPEEAMAAEAGTEDLQRESHASLDYLDGAKLTAEVIFSDGTEETHVYQLHTGKIKYSYEGGTGHVIPEFLSDEAQDQPYIYGILLASV